MSETPESLEPLVYVSITGLRVRHPRHDTLFWEHAVASMLQAQSAPGNLRAEARTVDDVHHTLSVWESREAMLAYLRSGPHLEAMRLFREIATGKVLGLHTATVPRWADVPKLWREQGRDV